jgi:hypothetical protein
MMNVNEPKDRIFNLEQKIDMLLKESQDDFYTEYLTQLKKRVKEQNDGIRTLQEEFDRNYAIYVQRNAVKDTYADTNADADSVTREDYMDNVTGDCKYVQPAKPAKKNNTEFVVGASILGAIGSVFILAAFVMFGMNYMTGFVKGMCLYVGFIALLLVSELFVYKRINRLGAILSATAIGGLYLSTAVNYLSLHNFTMWQALAVMLLLSAPVLFITGRRKSNLYKLIGMFASYLGFMMIESGISDTDFIVIAAMIILLDAVYCFVTADVLHQGTDITHMISNAVFTVAFCVKAVLCGIDYVYIAAFVTASIIIMHLIYIMRIKNNGKNDEKISSTGITAAYALSAVLTGIALRAVIDAIDIDKAAYLTVLENDFSIAKMAAMSAVAVIGIAAFAVLSAMKKSEKWFVYCFVSFMAVTIYIMKFLNTLRLTDGGGVEDAVCMFIFALLTKLILLKKADVRIKICDGIFTAILALGLPFATDVPEYILFITAVISIALIKYMRTYNETLLSLAVMLSVVSHMPSLLKLPMFVGVMFAAMLLFNHFERFRDRYIAVFNGIALAVQTVCYLCLFNPVYRNVYITYLCMLVFGIATIVLLFQPRYNMHFKYKSLVLAVFMTYMGLIFKSSEPILNSIIIMVVALVCVGLGFYNKEKHLRIYGLVLALLTCAKITLYDFMDAATLQKIVLFLAVGVIALIIAVIYIILEKKEQTL